ncbi:MAG: agmatine deiminase family protein [Bacilli bacterium]|nr:agmatine deiminase family protein [Bacilli bacterium]
MKKGGLLYSFLLIPGLVLSSCSFKLLDFLPFLKKEEISQKEDEEVKPSETPEQIDPSTDIDPEEEEKPVTPPDTEESFNFIKTPEIRMPAEFEPSSMIKMCYPNNMPLSVYKTIAEDNKLLILVNPNYDSSSRISEARSDFEDAGIKMENVTFLDMPIDDDYTYWVRDFSPFYVFKNKDLSVVDFTYNRPARTEQNVVPQKLANYFGMSYSKMSLTHTGGNLMQDGRGTAFSDDLVIQENSNNESKVRSQMEQFTGTDNYVITIDPQGDYIAHIDCWGKIVAPDKIIVAKLPQSNSRYQYYEQVANLLANTKCSYGYNYKVYRIEEPGGNIVAPYTNSLIANGHVYMPLGTNSTYNQKALQVYQEALPGYEIHGIQGFSSNTGLEFLNTDALHCRTHEVPDNNMLFIDSRYVYNGEVELKDKYVVQTNIVTYADAEVNEQDVLIKFSINNSSYQTSEMTRYEDTTNFTFTFEGLESGDDVKYYIEAKDSNNNSNVDPTCGELDPHHFTIV